jgi:RHH-type proline utilization regulon transcriptional repressor/proline dehydrogenase/delta 1-pyrroline-5-carboxylate dehydrogenase
LQTRIDDRVQYVSERIHAGNMYVNRNQIGAIVGSQPFGGEGLSGTGPKAGGPNYLARYRSRPAQSDQPDWTVPADMAIRGELILQAAEYSGRTQLVLPGPSGESNRLTAMARPPVLCLGPGAELASEQATAIRALGGVAVESPGDLPAQTLATLGGISGVIWWGSDAAARDLRLAIAQRDGPILALVTGAPDKGHACLERHVCVDTTAAGGNAALLAGAS